MQNKRIIKFKFWNKSDKIMTTRAFDIKECRNVSDNDLPLQFTGLLDKNGVEIYEGDIVYIGKGKTVVVEHDGYGFNNLDNGYPERHEILGNIYQDSHLLNKHYEKPRM